MKKQIVRVSILQTAKVAAMFYFLIALPVSLLLLIPMGMMGGFAGGIGGSILGAVMAAVAYPLVAFVGTVISAWLYNIVASKFGGFEFTTVEVGAR